MTKKEYTEYLNTNHWKTIRRIKLEQSDYKCQICSDKNKLNVHHNSYDNLTKEPLCDLCVLCETCHTLFHDRFNVEIESEEKRLERLSRSHILKYHTYGDDKEKKQQKIEDWINVSALGKDYEPY